MSKGRGEERYGLIMCGDRGRGTLRPTTLKKREKTKQQLRPLKKKGKGVVSANKEGIPMREDMRDTLFFFYAEENRRGRGVSYGTRKKREH